MRQQLFRVNENMPNNGIISELRVLAFMPTRGGLKVSLRMPKVASLYTLHFPETAFASGSLNHENIQCSR